MGLYGTFPGAQHAIGIDIGSHTIKVVQVVPSRNGYLLTHAGSTPTPTDAIKLGVVEDRLAVAEAINGLLHTLGITTPWVVAAVAGPTVIVRPVHLPVMPESQLRKSISWEARNHISFPVEDSAVSFQILGNTTVDGTPQMEVMLVAAPRELIDSRVEAIEQAGLEPITIELEQFALMRATTELPAEGTAELRHETVALVDIGATFTHITIVSNGVFVLTRSVTTAGNSFTKTVADALGVDLPQAEEIKEKETRVVSDEAVRAQLTPAGQQASRALESQLDELVREIRRSFAFYDYQQGPGGVATGDGVSRIILTGGSANLAGLTACMREQLSLPVDTINVFGHGGVQLPSGAEELTGQVNRLTTALGLALREGMLERDRGGSR